MSTKFTINKRTEVLDQEYSVIQSDRNSFCGDVVLGSFNMAFGDDNSILDQIYENKICYFFYMMI